MTTQTRNEVLLEGIALEAPALSHENHGTRFYRFPLQVPRLSGTPDTLPVLVPEALLTAVRLEDPLRVRGQLRSFNNRSGVGNRLVLTVYAQAMEPGSGEPCNRILLSGALCKPPIFRRTPLGRSICDLMLAVRRRDGRAGFGASRGTAGGPGGPAPGGGHAQPGRPGPEPDLPQGPGGRHRPGTGGLRGLRHAPAGAGGGRVSHPPGRHSDDHGPAGRAQQHPALAPGQLLQQDPVESLPRRLGA